MGFWLLVPGVGMGGGVQVVQTGRLEYTIPANRFDITIRKGPEHTLDSTGDYTVEVP